MDKFYLSLEFRVKNTLRNEERVVKSREFRVKNTLRNEERVVKSREFRVKNTLRITYSQTVT